LKSGIQKFDNFTLFDSSAASKKHEFGCRFYIREEFLKYIEGFKIINERICYLSLKAKWFSCTRGDPKITGIIFFNMVY
jgi:hypothetical protein